MSIFFEQPHNRRPWYEAFREKVGTFFKQYIYTARHREKAHIIYADLRKLFDDISPALGKHFDKIFFTFCFFVLFFSINYIFFWRAPRPFPDHALVTIDKGMSLAQISNKLEDARVIRSSLSLRIITILLDGERTAVAGDYYFSRATSVFGVAKMLNRGEFGLIPVRITIPEGISSFEIADILADKLPSFDKEAFKKEVTDGQYEGYLFPDTYFFMPNTKPSDIALIMRENFVRQINPYKADILKFDKPLEEIVTMASILEGEARGLSSQRIVADILWRRIRKEMPLQVDAPFKYYNGKNSYTLTKDDLAEDHGYNTYVKKGLPVGPISNPGVDAIRAAITPTPNQYYFFLTDKSGNMYYAIDFEGHKRNRVLYLNN